MTARLEDPTGAATTADFWLRLSSLEFRQSLWLPLVGNPYIQKADQVGKGIQARKTKTGRWRFESVEKSDWEVPEPPGIVAGLGRVPGEGWPIRPHQRRGLCFANSLR